MFDLEKPFTADSAVKEEDARAMKIALNHLGYYAPNPKLGITAIPDRGVFTALQAFQKDRGLQATATAKPNDKTVEALNTETEKQDSSNGQYIWHTVQDDHVRSAHKQRNGQIFSWNAPPEGGHPGEDYNCRCWAENVQLTEDVQKALEKAHKHLKIFKKDKYTLSVRFLEHYLGNTGEKIVLPENTFNNSSAVQSALKKNQERFEKKLELLTDKIALPPELNDYWDVDINKENLLESSDEDFIRAIGSVKIRSTGYFTIQRDGERIMIHGKVVNQFHDVYDFNADRVLDYVFFKNERFLAQKGYAKPFEIEWKKEQTFEGEFLFENGILKSKKFIWEK